MWRPELILCTLCLLSSSSIIYSLSLRNSFRHVPLKSFTKSPASIQSRRAVIKRTIAQIARISEAEKLDSPTIGSIAVHNKSKDETGALTSTNSEIQFRNRAIYCKQSISIPILINTLLTNYYLPKYTRGY